MLFNFSCQSKVLCRSLYSTKTCSQLICDIPISQTVRLFQLVNDVAFQFSLLVACSWQMHSFLVVAAIFKVEPVVAGRHGKFPNILEVEYDRKRAVFYKKV